MFGAKKNRTSIDKRVPPIVTLHCFYCLTPKTHFIMPILVRKAKMRLTYREEKPEVHVVRRLTYPKVTGKQLVQYAANAAAIPPATMQACIEAIVQAIYYYAIRGMRVTFPEFGGFYLQVRSKTARSEKELTADSFTYTGLAFQPLGDLRKLIADTNVVVQNAVYSSQLEQTPVEP